MSTYDDPTAAIAPAEVAGPAPDEVAQDPNRLHRWLVRVLHVLIDQAGRTAGQAQDVDGNPVEPSKQELHEAVAAAAGGFNTVQQFRDWAEHSDNAHAAHQLLTGTAPAPQAAAPAPAPPPPPAPSPFDH